MTKEQIKLNHAEIVARLISFVDDIASYGYDPAAWPLSDQERIAFTRRAIVKAHEIEGLMQFVELKMALAVDKDEK